MKHKNKKSVGEFRAGWVGSAQAAEVIVTTGIVIHASS
jgi:hypothetical protein